jgi:hypothetical protein
MHCRLKVPLCHVFVPINEFYQMKILTCQSIFKCHLRASYNENVVLSAINIFIIIIIYYYIQLSTFRLLVVCCIMKHPIVPAAQPQSTMLYICTICTYVTQHHEFLQYNKRHNSRSTKVGFKWLKLNPNSHRVGHIGPTLFRRQITKKTLCVKNFFN